VKLRLALVSASALVLLGSTTATALARPSPPGGQGSAASGPTYAPAATSSRLSASSAARTYFSRLNLGVQTGNFRAVDSMYTIDATLTQELTSSLPRLLQGTSQIGEFERAGRLSWSIEKVTRLSPTAVVTVEVGSGHRTTLTARYASLFTIVQGKVANVSWVPC
jgi:hypothetical protein